MNKNDCAASLLAECLVFIEELGHGPACDTWSGRRNAECDCDIPSLIRRIKKQLKVKANATAPGGVKVSRPNNGSTGQEPA